ncbi:class I SAM-dependent methyltransferase [Amphibiibacter pelophylacis]|uniref:SAM-dependent methyltransferase n=1 Tax=Amphibiibacter pelophylacis TaxID=1799477 RepID=A0ACC6P2H2_9BURK
MNDFPAPAFAPVPGRLGPDPDLHAALLAARDASGWLRFDAFMQQALYHPQAGYYTRSSPKLGERPESGSDFVTAPELTPLFGHTLAAQVTELLQASGTQTVLELGAGSGALAEALLDVLPPHVAYRILDVSPSLRGRQAQRLARFGERVQWLEALPESFEGVILGNELLDAVPVRVVVRSVDDEPAWRERGAVWDDTANAWQWQDRPLDRALLAAQDARCAGLLDEIAPQLPPGYTSEIHPQGQALVGTLAARLKRGAMLWLDYGFEERTYYHPQRATGTLMCHRAHRADDQPLAEPGEKDITAHVNFTGVALAAQDAGLDVLGYTSQGRFLINCGLPQRLAELPQATAQERVASARTTANAHKLWAEHEMGELFKVLLLGRGLDATRHWLGFAQGDRTGALG